MVFFALGLMAKPMLVTLPFLLLLLDYWPLGRLAGIRDWGLGIRSVNGAKPGSSNPQSPIPNPSDGGNFPGRAVWEKLPLLAVGAAASGMALWAQGEARESNEFLALSERLGHALVSYVVYLGRLVYPADLAVLYPRPEDGSPVFQQAFLALVLLAAITAAAVFLRRKHPYLLVGWLWYVGMLFPASGAPAVWIRGRNGPLTASLTCPRSDW